MSIVTPSGAISCATRNRPRFIEARRRLPGIPRIFSVSVTLPVLSLLPDLCFPCFHNTRGARIVPRVCWHIGMPVGMGFPHGEFCALSGERGFSVFASCGYATRHECERHDGARKDDYAGGD